MRRNNSQNLQVGHLRQRYLWGETSSQGAAGVSSRWVVDQILAEEAVDNGSDETVQWTLTDHLNTVRDIAQYDPDDDMTTVVNHLIYDAFGRVTSESNPAVDSLFLFTGRPFDSDTGFQNNLNRWYDPTAGRWLSEDPIGFVGQDGNLYRYVRNHTLNHRDPAGLSIISPIPILGTIECWLTTFPGTRIGDYDRVLREGKASSREECCSSDPGIRDSAITRCRNAVRELANAYTKDVALTYGLHLVADVAIDVVGLYVTATITGPGGIAVTVVGFADTIAAAWCVSDAAEKIGATAAWFQKNVCCCPV